MNDILFGVLKLVFFNFSCFTVLHFPTTNSNCSVGVSNIEKRIQEGIMEDQISVISVKDALEE